MTNWKDQHQKLMDILGLRHNPIAITFSNDIPEGIERFEADVPEPTEDGRTGPVSAGCEFWIHSTEQTFYTEEQDHENCSVGSVTHGFKNWDQVLEKNDVATILECGWVQEDDVPQIATSQDKYDYITYGPLEETPIDPDVVFIRINGEQLMRMKDAFPEIRIEGKPQCHIVPLSKDEKIPAVSTGCALSRKRTGMSSNEMSATIPGDKFDEIIDQLEDACGIDDMVAEYAQNDKQRFN